MTAFNIDIVSQRNERQVFVKSNGETYMISVSCPSVSNWIDHPELMVFKCNEHGEVDYKGVAYVGLPDDYHASKCIAEYILKSRNAGEFIGSYHID